jgi:hypothetical protein
VLASFFSLSQEIKGAITVKQAVTLMFDMARLPEAARQSWSSDFHILILQLVEHHLAYCLNTTNYATGRVWQLTVKDWSVQNFAFLREQPAIATSVCRYHTYEVCEMDDCYQPVAAADCPDLGFWQLHTRTGEYEHEIYDRCLHHCLRPSSREIVRTVTRACELAGNQWQDRVIIWQLRGRWYAQRLFLLDTYLGEDGVPRGMIEATPWLGPQSSRDAILEIARERTRLE